MSEAEEPGILAEWAVSALAPLTFQGPPQGRVLFYGDNQAAVITGTDDSVVNAILIGLNKLEAYREAFVELREICESSVGRRVMAKEILGIINKLDREMDRVVNEPPAAKAIEQKPRFWLPGQP